MKIKPLGARILIQEIKPEEKTSSGIILPANKEKTQMAKVIAVGESTEKTKITVSVGDTIIFSQYAGTPIKDNREEFRVVNMEDVLAKVED